MPVPSVSGLVRRPPPLEHEEFGHYAAHTNTWAGAFNTFVLLSSSLCAVLAHQPAEQKDGKKAADYLLFTVLGGLAFLCVKGYEWGHEIHREVGTHGTTSDEFRPDRRRPRTRARLLRMGARGEPAHSSDEARK